MEADVIVIGAGAAGLAAARTLARRSRRVIVLEARNRVGGRVWPRAVQGSKIPAELGAEFIHGPATETMQLLREAGLRAVPIGREGWSRDDDGELRRDDEGFTAAAAILEKAGTLAGDESVEHFLRRFEGDERARETIADARAFVEGFEAADPAIASARAIACELRSGTDSSSARPVDGYGPMFERLLAACTSAGVELRLNTKARRVAWRRGAVTVDAAGPRGTIERIRARAAVVTLPVGVLRHRGGERDVTFEPPLPGDKSAALEKIEMGHAIKVALSFRTPFWEELHDGRYRDGAFFRRAGQPFAAYWTQMPLRETLIVAWAGGPKATAIGGLPERELVASALDGFGALFDEPARARREFVDGAMHDWTRDPYARGAYSYVAVGGSDARALLAEPLDETLFFAGEATSSDGQGGTVNGALETGERAAGEVRA